MGSRAYCVSGRLDFAFFVNLEMNGIECILNWCRTMGLISNIYECPECNLPMQLERGNNIDGYAWVCHQKGENEHSVERSVRLGTFFQLQSNLCLIDLFFITYLWIAKAPKEFIADEVNVPEKTLYDWQKFLREFCLKLCLKNNTKIGGEGIIVEILGTRYHKMTNFKDDNEGSWIFVGFERESDKGFIEIVEEENPKFLSDAISKYVIPGTILVSDCWQLYDCLNEEEFVDLKNKQSIQYEDLNFGVYGTSIKSLRLHVKKTFGDDPDVPINLDLYLAEYMWRRKHSDSIYELVNAFFEEIVVLFPPDTHDNYNTYYDRILC